MFQFESGNKYIKYKSPAIEVNNYDNYLMNKAYFATFRSSIFQERKLEYKKLNLAAAFSVRVVNTSAI